MKLSLKYSGIFFLLLFLQDFTGGSLIHYAKLKGKSSSASGRSMKKEKNKGPVLITKPKRR
jgi:hypothetical protein